MENKSLLGVQIIVFYLFPYVSRISHDKKWISAEHTRYIRIENIMRVSQKVNQNVILESRRQMRPNGRFELLSISFGWKRFKCIPSNSMPTFFVHSIYMLKFWNSECIILIITQNIKNIFFPYILVFTENKIFYKIIKISWKKNKSRFKF